MALVASPVVPVFVAVLPVVRVRIRIASVIRVAFVTVALAWRAVGRISVGYPEWKQHGQSDGCSDEYPLQVPSPSLAVEGSSARSSTRLTPERMPRMCCFCAGPIGPGRAYSVIEEAGRGRRSPDRLIRRVTHSDRRVDMRHLPTMTRSGAGSDGERALRV